MYILVCNAGSTSLKLKLYDMPECAVVAQCAIERVRSADDALFKYSNKISGEEIFLERQSIPDYRKGMDMFLSFLTSPKTGVLSRVDEIARVGFKSVLSKNHFGVHELTENALDGMRQWLALAKIHNPAYLETIETMREVLPNALFIGVFETAFHTGVPLERKLYGVPYEWYEKYGVQRLGYHSASHGYIASVLNEKSENYRAISCHLGGSCSICAIENGKSVDNSFGMSLQSGVIHANRTGDMDCDLTDFLRSEGMSDNEITDGLVKNGGLLGISGVSGDLRYVEAAAREGNLRAKLAIDVFVNGIILYIGAYYVELKGLDYLVFTGGIGENSATVRDLVCSQLEILGVQTDADSNKNGKGFFEISTNQSKVKVLVIPTDEELGIAKKTFEYAACN